MHPPGKHGGQKPTAPARQIHGKFQNMPKWTAPDTVLGYTYEFALNAEMVREPNHGEGVLSFNKARLLEIYYDAGRLSSHPLRNRFRWAETGLRPLLHELAVEGV